MGTGFWQCVTALARWTCPHTDPEPVETDSAQKSQFFVHILLLLGFFFFGKMWSCLHDAAMALTQCVNLIFKG